MSSDRGGGGEGDEEGGASESGGGAARESQRSRVVITEEDRLLAQRLLGNRSSVGRPVSQRTDAQGRPMSARSGAGGVGDRSSVRSEGLTQEQRDVLAGMDPALRAEVEADMRAGNRSSLPPALPPRPGHGYGNAVADEESLPMAEYVDLPTAAFVRPEEEDGYDPDLGGIKHMSQDGRVLVTKMEEHRGRPASVTVELGPDGKVRAIVGGTAQLPGETRKQYLRQMSSFAFDQLADIPLSRGITWKGGQKYAYFCFLVFVITGAILIAEFSNNNWQMEDFNKNPTAGPSAEVLLHMGAKRTDLIRAGEFHRLISAFWLHGGLLHWIFNMIGLYSMCVPMEKEFGTPKIAIIYLVSGFVGVLASSVFAPTRIGVGASGAIFGLFGAAWADLIQNWGLYKTRKTAISTLIQLVISTVINIFIGFAPFLDAFAHMGGMICGAFLGFSLLLEKRYTRFAEPKDFKVRHRVLQLVGALSTPISVIVLLIWLFTAQDPNSWCSWCKYIDCIPVQDLWTCDDCTDAGLTGEAFANQTLFVNCPGGKQVWGNLTRDWTQATTADLLVLCKAKCFARS